MMALSVLFAERVILGKTAFKEVPPGLKSEVAHAILEAGVPQLVPISYGGEAPDEV